MALFDMSPEGWLAFASQVSAPSQTRSSPLHALSSAYMGGMDATRKGQQQAYLRQKQQMEMEEMQRARAEAERGRQAMAEYRPSGATPYENLLNQARFFESKGMMREARQAMLDAEKFKPKFSTTPQYDQEGNAFVLDEGGNRKPLEGVKARDKIVSDDLGGQRVYRTEYSAAPVAQAAKTMTPEGQDTSKRGWANYGLEQQKFGYQQGKDATDSGKKVSEQAAAVRKELNSLPPVQNYREALPVFQSAIKAPDTPAGDLDLIYAVGKVFDPNSVVREGEMALVIKAGTPMQRWEGAVRSIVQGKGRLTPSQRQQLQATLQGRVTELKGAHDRALTPYQSQIRALGLPEDQIFAPQVESAAPSSSNDPLGIRR